MDDNTETRIDELDLYTIPGSYPPRHNPRKVIGKMGIEDPIDADEGASSVI